MPSVTFSLPAGTSITPKNGMKFQADQVKNGVVQLNCFICMLPVDPTFTGLLLTSVETSTPSYAPSGATATVDLTIINDTGSPLSSVVLTTSHNGNGILTVGTVPTTMAIGEAVTITLSYATSSEAFDVTVNAEASGVKLDTTTATSNAIARLLDITGKFLPPPPPE